MAGHLNLTLYSRPGCHLCEDLKAALAALQGDIDFTVVERNIEDDPADMARYRYLIPVLDIENGPLLYPPHAWTALVDALQAAAMHTAPMHTAGEKTNE